MFFENTLCERCGSTVAFFPRNNALITLKESNGANISIKGESHQYCENRKHGVCNWLIEKESDTYCLACSLNQTIPNLNNPSNHTAWKKLEVAKHRLIYALLRLSLPIEVKEDPESSLGLAFEFLSPEEAPDEEPVMTGHADGTITLNINEANNAERERLRAQLGEPYRTLIGHMRHEIGHYYWQRLIVNHKGNLDKFRSYFGDERQDYGKALESYYQNDPNQNWNNQFLSTYASSHPWEDWAETWAHYFHIMDTVETAHWFGMRISPKVSNDQSVSVDEFCEPYAESEFEKILQSCLPLTFAVNSLNRGMGQPDIYPFILNDAVVNKFNFVHKVIGESKIV